MALKIKKGNKEYWIDPKGLEIPRDLVKRDDRKRDKAVERAIKLALELNQITAKKKAEITEVIGEYLQDLASTYGEDWKGNAVLRDFSDRYRVDVSIDDSIVFDETLQIAQQKIGHCIERWGKGAPELRTLVNRAFKTDGTGNVNKQLVLGLRQYNFDDPEWREAMDIISNSVKVVSRKAYYKFAKRRAGDNAMEPINVNFTQL